MEREVSQSRLRESTLDYRLPHPHFAAGNVQAAALELMRAKRPNFAQIEEYCRSPKAFLQFLDAAGVDRAVLINYVAPEVIGFTAGVNQFVSDYVKENPKRLLSCGSLHPRHSTNILADVEQLVRLGIRMIKIHPPHQLLFPERLPARRHGTGNHLPGRRSQWHSGDVPHRALRSFRARATSTATRFIWMTLRSISRR